MSDKIMEKSSTLDAKIVLESSMRDFDEAVIKSMAQVAKDYDNLHCDKIYPYAVRRSLGTEMPWSYLKCHQDVASLLFKQLDTTKGICQLLDVASVVANHVMSVIFIKLPKEYLSHRTLTIVQVMKIYLLAKNVVELTKKRHYKEDVSFALSAIFELQGLLYRFNHEAKVDDYEGEGADVYRKSISQLWEAFEDPKCKLALIEAIEEHIGYFKMVQDRVVPKPSGHDESVQVLNFQLLADIRSEEYKWGNYSTLDLGKREAANSFAFIMKLSAAEMKVSASRLLQQAEDCVNTINTLKEINNLIDKLASMVNRTEAIDSYAYMDMVVALQARRADVEGWRGLIEDEMIADMVLVLSRAIEFCTAVVTFDQLFNWPDSKSVHLYS